MRKFKIRIWNLKLQFIFFSLVLVEKTKISTAWTAESADSEGRFLRPIPRNGLEFHLFMADS